MEEHIGFCMSEYDKNTCQDCIALNECLKLKKEEKIEFDSRKKKDRRKEKREIERRQNGRDTFK